MRTVAKCRHLAKLFVIHIRSNHANTCTDQKHCPRNQPKARQTASYELNHDDVTDYRYEHSGKSRLVQRSADHHAHYQRALSSTKFVPTQSVRNTGNGMQFQTRDAGPIAIAINSHAILTKAVIAPHLADTLIYIRDTTGRWRRVIFTDGAAYLTPTNTIHAGLNNSSLSVYLFHDTFIVQETVQALKK